MSTDADSVRSGRSRDTIHNAISMGVSLAIQLGISNTPVLGEIYDVFLAISMFVDRVLNPENVGTFETRDSLNKTCKHNTDEMLAAFAGSDVVAAITSSAKQLNPTITDDELKRQIAIQTSLYHRELVFPPVTCFNDFVNADASGIKLAVSFSGPPTDACKHTALSYYNAYYSFIYANKDKYTQEKINDASNVKDILRAIIRIESENKINQDRDSYNNQFLIVGLLFGFSLIVVLILFLVQTQKEGGFSPKKQQTLPRNK
jgi:hypothetical protein